MSMILIIDDDDDFRSGFKEVLELETYYTLEAENGLVGWQMIQQHVPDIVICDVDMPIMNGIELLRTVKSDALLKKIPFVIVSGQSDKQTLTAAYDLGVAAYLIKPVPVAQFLTTIAHYSPLTFEDW